MKRQQKGASTIEFVLLFPLFAGMLYLIIGFGIVFAQLHVIEGMVADILRQSRSVVTTEGDPDKAIGSLISNYLGESPAFWVPGNVRFCDEGEGEGEWSAYHDYKDATGVLKVCIAIDVPLPGPLLPSTLESRSSIQLAVPDE